MTVAKPRDKLTARTGARLLAAMISVEVKRHGSYELSDTFDEFLKALPDALRPHGLVLTREPDRWLVTKEAT